MGMNLKTLFRIIVIEAALLLTISPLQAQAPDLDLTAIEATAPTPANQIPVAATFYSAQNLDLPPMPGNFYSLPAWSLGDGIYLLDDVGSGVQPMDAVPQIPGGWETNGGGGGGSNVPAIWTPPDTISATNYAAYNQFYLTISQTGTLTSVSLINTLSNISYEVLTNSNISTTNWGFYTNVTATSNDTPLQPVNLGTNTVFFWAKMIWSTCDNPSALPDWESMLYFNSLCDTTNGLYITNGLEAYWKFNDGIGTTSASSISNGFALPLPNSPPWGFAWLTLNGPNGTDQYGDAGPNALTDLDNHDMTVCAWINTSNPSFEGIVDKEFYNSSGHGGWTLVVQTNQLIWAVESVENFVDTGPDIVPSGQWTFVAAVWHYAPLNGSNHVEFYINGVLNSTAYYGPDQENPSGTADLLVGNCQNNAKNGQYVFDGSMHDVGVYNRALLAAEVVTNFLSTEFDTNILPPNLLYYKMTEAGETNDPLTLINYASGGGTNGSMILVGTNKPPEWHGGVGSVSNGLHFNGSYSHLDTFESTNFNFTTNSFSINVWLRPYVPTNYIMGNNTYGSNGWFLALDDGYLLFGAETDEGEVDIQTSSTFHNWPAGPIQYATNWNMVTITRVGTHLLVIYINALPVATVGSLFPKLISTTNTLVFGEGVFLCDGSVITNYLDGDIWLPQVWSTALSQSDIAKLYCNQLWGMPWP